MNRVGNYIETYSGKRFYPLDPRQDEIDVYDIAHALSNQCRFSGHTRCHYSVAQHCVHVSHLVAPYCALEGLLHDASEAYLIDLPRPLKRAPEMQFYRDAEAKLMRVIEGKYGLRRLDSENITDADNAALVAEARSLMIRLTPDWTAEIRTNTIADPREVHPWTPSYAKAEFLNRFFELWESRYRYVASDASKRD